jgi:hypothetical protein
MVKADLSEVAATLLAQVGGNERASNLKRLRSDVDLSDDQFEAALAELKAAHLVEPLGKGGRIRRVSAGQPKESPSNRGERRPQFRLSDDARRVLDALPADGSTISNIRLRPTLDLNDDAYATAIRELKDAHAIQVGPGRGGTVQRSEAGPAATLSDDHVEREAQLYEPFVNWLNSSWSAVANPSVRFAHAKVTATPRGRNRDTGKWSRPDVTAVRVLRFEWLPDIVLEVSSFEIKRAADAIDLESVYEAAAHGRWAHLASLVLENPGRELSERFLDEIRRFNLGLYVMNRRPGGEGFEIEPRVEPQPQHPDSTEVNALLDHFFQDERKRAEYRTAIGK